MKFLDQKMTAIDAANRFAATNWAKPRGGVGAGGEDDMTRNEKEVRGFTDKALAEHVITERMRSGVYRSWRCQKPGTWTYGFDITTYPGTIVITGDIGDLIVQRVYDMLPWCRSSVNDAQYFASKVPHAIQTKEFSDNELRRWIKDELKDKETKAEHKKILKEAVLHLDDSHGSEWWHERLYDVWIGNDPPGWKDYTRNFLWCRDAIRWFVMKHDEPDLNKALGLEDRT